MRRLPVLASLAVGWMGCASITSTVSLGGTAESLAADGRAEGLPIVNPLVLPPGVAWTVVHEIGLGGSPKQRMDRLRRWLRDADPAFVYSEQETYTAGQFFEIRRGDCFSYTNIFVALARALDVDARYVYVREGLIRESQGGYVDSAHIAAEYGTGPRPEVVDFFQQPDERTLPEFHPLTDIEAGALFNSNLAVGYLLRGRIQRAADILEFLSERVPTLPELPNNYAVALMESRRLGDAHSVVQSALERFPDFPPLYSNALTVATAQGDEAMARSLETWGRDVANNDPLFVFGQGIRRYQHQDYSGAAERFERVTRLQERSAIAWAWLSRAQDAAGNPEDSHRSGRQALSLGSSDPRVLAILAPIGLRASPSR